MYAQVGEFRVSWIITTVPLTFLHFFLKQNARNTGNRCRQLESPSHQLSGSQWAEVCLYGKIHSMKFIACNCTTEESHRRKDIFGASHAMKGTFVATSSPMTWASKLQKERRETLTKTCENFRKKEGNFSAAPKSIVCKSWVSYFYNCELSYSTPAHFTEQVVSLK